MLLNVRTLVCVGFVFCSLSLASGTRETMPKQNFSLPTIVIIMKKKNNNNNNSNNNKKKKKKKKKKTVLVLFFVHCHSPLEQEKPCLNKTSLFLQ